MYYNNCYSIGTNCEPIHDLSSNFLTKIVTQLYKIISDYVIMIKLGGSNNRAFFYYLVAIIRVCLLVLRLYQTMVALVCLLVLWLHQTIIVKACLLVLWLHQTMVVKFCFIIC